MSNKEEQSELIVVEYEYFGLSTSAEVRRVKWLAGYFYRCYFHSSIDSVDIGFKKEPDNQFWVDLNIGTPTPLAQILGQAIENKIGTVQPLTNLSL